MLQNLKPVPVANVYCCVHVYPIIILRTGNILLLCYPPWWLYYFFSQFGYFYFARVKMLLECHFVFCCCFFSGELVALYCSSITNKQWPLNSCLIFRTGFKEYELGSCHKPHAFFPFLLSTPQLFIESTLPHDSDL